MDSHGDVSRRALVEGGMAVLLGGVGFAAAEALAAAPALAQGAPTEFTVRGTDWRLWSNAEAGVPGHGQRATVTGKLATDRGAAGSFCGSSTFVDAAYADTAADATLEFHTFTLPDGTIAGMGNGRAGQSTFTVMGGTGRYEGARGTYTGRQDPLELGGDGTAEFDFRLL